MVTAELVMVVESVPGSPDLVQISIVDQEYPAALLAEQISAMAFSFGSEPVGLRILPATAVGAPLKAVFSVPGLIDRSSGDVRLQPIVRAFMSGGDTPIKAFSITFHGVSPTAYTTLASYRSPTAALQAFYDESAQTLEYRVLALTEDPDELVIPTRFVPASFEPVTVQPQQSRAMLLLVLVILAGGSAGALVYFALLGRQA